MDSKRVIWLSKDEAENIRQYGISFKLAKEVIENEASLKCSNIHKDYSFIGLTNDMNLVVFVYCIDEEGFRKIKRAREATKTEENIFFYALSRGEYAKKN